MPALPVLGETTCQAPRPRRELGAGEVGEIVIRGYMTPGYYKDPEQNAAAFDADGFFRTGGFGTFDDDGRLRFRGRLKEMVKTGGSDEFLFGLPGLGIGQQREFRYTPTEDDLLVYRMAGVTPRDVDALYTYDAFSPLVWFVLERLGFCGLGEAAAWTQDGRIELGGELPMNTSGGLLSEAHVSGWNSIVEIVRQVRGSAASVR